MYRITSCKFSVDELMIPWKKYCRRRTTKLSANLLQNVQWKAIKLVQSFKVLIKRNVPLNGIFMIKFSHLINTIFVQTKCYTRATESGTSQVIKNSLPYAHAQWLVYCDFLLCLVYFILKGKTICKFITNKVITDRLMSRMACYFTLNSILTFYMHMYLSFKKFLFAQLMPVS